MKSLITYTDNVHDTILNDGYSVPFGFEEPLCVYLEFHGGEIVKGMIREDTGYSIDFYIFAQTGYYT